MQKLRSLKREEEEKEKEKGAWREGEFRKKAVLTAQNNVHLRPLGRKGKVTQEKTIAFLSNVAEG